MKGQQKYYVLFVIENWQKGIKVKKKLYTLENSEEIYAYTQMGEEELLSQQERGKDQEIMHNIDLYRCAKY